MMRHFHLVENSWRTVWLITLFQVCAHCLALRELKFVIITESGTWYNCLVWVRSLICLIIKVRNERYSSFSTPCCVFQHHFVSFFTPFCAFLTVFCTFLSQNLNFWGNYRKSYRKPIYRPFSNYRSNYRYRFNTSINYR